MLLLQRTCAQCLPLKHELFWQVWSSSWPGSQDIWHNWWRQGTSLWPQLRCCCALLLAPFFVRASHLQRTQTAFKMLLSQLTQQALDTKAPGKLTEDAVVRKPGVQLLATLLSVLFQLLAPSQDAAVKAISKAFTLVRSSCRHLVSPQTA